MEKFRALWWRLVRRCPNVRAARTYFFLLLGAGLFACLMTLSLRGCEARRDTVVAGAAAS